MSPLQLCRSALLALGLFLGFPDSSSAQVWLILGVEVPKDIVAVCATRTQVETIVKTYSERGEEEAMKAFLARDCFVGRVGFTPEFLLSSRRVNREVMSIVEISVTYAPKQTVFYMLTHRAVLGGLKI